MTLEHPMTTTMTPRSSQILRRGDDGYDEARTVWNAMIDRHPRLIVRCTTTADVVAAVRYAREHDLEIGVRCGGHSVVGLAVPEDGLMIDLRPMDAVSIDPVRRRARVQGGALLGSLDRAAQEYGLATTAGNVSHTGVGGLTLGGGMGWLARQFGLACDNVTAYEMVTANGEVVRATATENPELFWGLRGGGGNFGIVTEFEFRLHEVGTRALVADLYFPVEQGFEVLRGWRDLNAHAPRKATLTAGITTASESFPAELRGRTVVRAGFVWVGDPAEGRSLLLAIKALGTPVLEQVEEMSYVELQSMDDSIQGHHLRRYWKGHYLSQLTDDAIRAFLQRGDGDYLPSAGFQAYGGAIADVPESDAAFSHRTTLFEFVTATSWSDPAEDEPRMAAVRRYAATLDRYAAGAYVNTLTDEGVRRAYPADKLVRLTALKDVLDPTNVFHLNQNITPSERS
jgi:FAD/FMN-containing dehydrogenase